MERERSAEHRKRHINVNDRINNMDSARAYKLGRYPGSKRQTGICVQPDLSRELCTTRFSGGRMPNEWNELPGKA